MVYNVIFFLFSNRFEEPDKEFIHRHPRVINETVRKKDNKRKEDRDKKKNKLKEEEEKKKQELLRLKALKKQEIMNKIEMLKEAAGIENEFNPEVSPMQKSPFLF